MLSIVLTEWALVFLPQACKAGITYSPHFKNKHPEYREE